MKEMNQNELNNLQKIADSIQNLKNLKTLKFNICQTSVSQVFIVEDNVTKIQYCLKIISIFDDYDDVCQQKLNDAKNEADFLMKCSHPNVVKYVDQFQINFHYFILMEKCEKNLQQWIEDQNNAAISYHQLISFACQTLSAIQYIHRKNYVLRDLSLKNILIDRYNRIKIYDFGLAKKIYSDISSQKYLEINTEVAKFYFPPEIINQSIEQMSNNNKEFEQSYQSNIWGFGICISILGGATYKDCLSIQTSGYKYINQLDEGFNQILSKVLSLQQNERPSIEYIIKEFEILKQKVWNPSQANILFLESKKNGTENIQRALELVLICVDISHENLEYQIELGNIMNKLKYFDDAINQCQKCLEINPKNYQSYHNLGVIFTNKGMVDEAIQSYQKSLELNPQNDDGYYNLGILFVNKDMMNEAIESYLKCLEINPKNDNCQNNLGIVYDNKDMVDEAIQSYKKCVEINPKNDNCYYNLGLAYQNKDMFDEAIQYYQKCLEINPKNVICYYNLGTAYQNKGMFDEAIQQYQKCLEINPKNDNCYMNLGVSYQNKDMLDEAIQSYQKCLELNPQNDGCYYNLGIVYDDKGMVDEAIQSYKKCLETKPKFGDCYYNLGIAYDVKKMVDEAIVSFKKYLEINPYDCDCYCVLGIKYERKGMVGEAIKWFKKGLELDPSQKKIKSKIKWCKKEI